MKTKNHSHKQKAAPLVADPRPTLTHRQFVEQYPTAQPVGYQGPLLTRQQLADRWCCCPHTVARRKDIHAVRLGRRLVRYRLKDIEAIEAAAVGE